MKNRYPFLYFWKIKGFNEFPGVPAPPLYEEQRKKTLKGLKDYHKTPEAQLMYGPNPEPAPMDEEIIKGYNKIIDKQTTESLIDAGKRYLTHEFMKLGKLAYEAREKVIKDAYRFQNRNKILKALGNKILPKTRGGPSILTEDQKGILKNIYIELQSCIKEIRKKIQVPLKKTDDNSYWGRDDSDDIKNSFPEISDIFLEDELQFITKEPSIANIAAKIMVKRLNTSIGGEISYRTLQNKLSQVSPALPDPPNFRS